MRSPTGIVYISCDPRQRFAASGVDERAAERLDELGGGGEAVRSVHRDVRDADVPEPSQGIAMPLGVGTELVDRRIAYEYSTA